MSMLIKDNVPALHREIAEFLSEQSPFGDYLQCFLVVSGRRNMISRIMFKKGGLKRFLDDCRNADNPLYISERAEASLCCTRLSSALMEKMNAFNENRPEGRRPVPYGCKIWVGSSLGIYFTIGNQDLEAFFEEGRRLAVLNVAAAIDDGDHQHGEPG
jgi:hypothetical protein